MNKNYFPKGDKTTFKTADDRRVEPYLTMLPKQVGNIVIAYCERSVVLLNGRTLTLHELHDVLKHNIVSFKYEDQTDEIEEKYFVSLDKGGIKITVEEHVDGFPENDWEYTLGPSFDLYGPDCSDVEWFFSVLQRMVYVAMGTILDIKSFAWRDTPIFPPYKHGGVYHYGKRVDHDLVITSCDDDDDDDSSSVDE